MTDGVATVSRLLDLLALLQHRSWTGPELAAELGVTQRSVRRDVQRLREAGYPIDAVPGVGGGYRLVAGRALPPLILDDEAAVAVAVCLRLASVNPVEGIGEGALRALAVIDQVLPNRLRHTVEALQRTTDTLRAPVAPGEQVAGAHLLALARACQGRERVCLDYRSHEGRDSTRRMEPYRLVTTGRRWYLLAWDVDRDDWRTLRVDRIRSVAGTGWRFTPRPAPAALDFVRRAITQAPYRWQVRLRVALPPSELRPLSPAAVEVLPEPGGESCELRFGVHEVGHAVRLVAGLLLDHGDVVEVLDPPEVGAACRDLAQRLGRIGG